MIDTKGYPMTSASLPDDLIRLTPAAKLVGVHLATLYRWLSAGRLPCYKVGPCQRRVSRREVLELVRPERAQLLEVEGAIKAAGEVATVTRAAETVATLEGLDLAKYLRR